MTPFPYFKIRSFANIVSSLKKGKGISILFLFILCGGFTSAADAASASCPAEYGKTLYECNPAEKKQLFIIGIGHRDALTGANGHRTAKIQAEVYKIGEWLIRQEGVDLLLPEGFFSNPGGKKAAAAPPDYAKNKSPEPLDLKTLEAKLSDKTTFINAEILLKRNYPLVLHQVEDKECYTEVGALLGKLTGGDCAQEEYARTREELDSLQDKRTAVMLQKIPEIINREYREGRIKARKAIFTIGLSHIPPILKFLKDGKVPSSFPPHGAKDFQTLNLKREKFRVSILIPKSLAEDPNLLGFHKLDRILATASPAGKSGQK